MRGHGGLDWALVEPLIVDKLSAIPDVDVILYPPVGVPAAAAMPSVGPAPSMSLFRAALVEVVARYVRFAVGGASLIEVQKLLYFLQSAGEPLGLSFKPHRYGPYADEIRHALVDVEGHYLVGFGDGSSKVLEAETMTALPGAAEAARVVMSDHPETASRLDDVLHLVEGYESAYSMELLSSVHWIATARPELALDPIAIAAELRAWSPRKQRLFTDGHVSRAWTTLGDRGWIDQPVLAN